MIFIDKIKELDKKLNPEFDRLLNLAWKNQTHIGDLLLVGINGFYDKKTHEFNAVSDIKYNPHVIGQGSEGHSEQTHYNFIHKYRTTNISQYTYLDYLKLHEWSSERSKEINELVDFEETTIQLEMLIYIKFWEADMIIKKFYQLVRIMHGEQYDWYFKAPKFPGDKEATDTRQNLIRLKIRDRLKDISPILHDLIANTYKTQIRNSIAHSNYSFLGRNIYPNNYIENDPTAKIKSLSFDEWIDIFHNTLALQNQYTRMKNIINHSYGELVSKSENEMEIRISEKDGKQYPAIVYYRPEFKDWGYK